jgi:hypothetical protein
MFSLFNWISNSLEIISELTYLFDAEGLDFDF